MAKPSTHRLLLSQEEFLYLQKNVPRHLQHVKSIKEREPKNKELTKRFLDSVSALVDKLALPPEVQGSELILKSNRQDLRLLHDIVTVEHTATVTKVVPGYADRMSKDRETYEPYYKKSLERAAMLNGLLNKIKERIG